MTRLRVPARCESKLVESPRFKTPDALAPIARAAHMDLGAGSCVSPTNSGAGGVGSVAAGILADRFGRTTITSAAMIISGTSAVLAAFLFDAPLIVLVPVLLVWGLTVVADSAQFSAAVTELCPPEYLGTVLTTQTALGFTLPLFSIQLIPIFVDAQGWTLAFLMLAVGPALGTWAMLRLRRLPEAAALAGGRR